MKNIYTFLLLTTLVCNSASAQDPTYGDEFLKWVKNNSKDFSVKLTEADFKTRMINIHTNHYQQSITDSKFISLALDSLQITIGNQEQELQKAEKIGGDSIKNALKRSAYAQEVLNALGKVLVKLESIQQAQKKIDSLGTKNIFLFSGLSHVGKENLLESITDLSNSLSNTLVADYTIGVYYSNDGTGSSISLSGTSGSGTSAAIAGAAFLAARIVASYGPQFYPYAAALVLVGVMVGSDAIVRFNKKIEEQNKIVIDALNLFQKLIPSSDEMYQLYKIEDQNNKKDFKLLQNQLDSITSQQYLSWKNLYKFNVYRLESAKLVLTKEKVRQIQESYFRESSVRKLFSARLLNDLNLDLQQQFAEIASLENKASNETDQLSWLISREEYSDALYEADAWLKVLKNESVFIPLFKIISTRQDEIKMRINKESSNAEFSSIPLNPNIKKIGLYADGKEDLNIIALKKEIEKASSKHARKVSQTKMAILAPVAQSLPEQPYISFNAGIYAVSYTNDGSFRERYPPGQDLINSIISGTSDGGYKSDSRVASGVDKLNAATNNINKRIAELQVDYNSLTNTKNIWKEASKEFNKTLLANINSSLKIAEDRFNSFQATNQNAIAGIQREMQTFLTSQINGNSLNEFLEQTNIYSRATSNVPSYHTRVNSSPILGQSIATSVFPPSNTIQQNEIIREGFKTAVSSDDVDSRVKNNFSNGTTDPVFSSIEKYNDLKKLLDNSLSYARYFSDSKNEIVKRQPMSSAEISNGYLHQAKLLRFYSEGKITDVQFRDFSIMDLELLAEEYRKLLIEFDISCNAGNAGDVASPCNRFTAMVLKSIYKIDDFINIPSGDNQQIPLANKIYEFVSTDEKWHLIGSANSQDANDAAALYAAEGRPVIAIQPNATGSGHVCVVLPGIPKEGTGNPGYGPVKLPYVASWFKDHPEKTFYYRKLSYAFGNGEGVVFYYRDLP